MCSKYERSILTVHWYCNRQKGIHSTASTSSRIHKLLGSLIQSMIYTDQYISINMAYRILCFIIFIYS